LFYAETSLIDLYDMLTELFAAPETVEDMVIEKRKVTSTGCEP
jgi:hypothetical protein